MTEREALWTGVVLSLFVHFLLLSHAPGPPDQAAFSAVVRLEMESSAASARRERGLDVAAAAPGEKRDAEAARAAERKRRAFLHYLDAIDEAVHARRLETGGTDLIGVAVYTFLARADGTFSEPALRSSSGDPRLDASARRAILAASGTVRRPAEIGSEPVPVILEVKYQYGLR